jgi:dTMP kinase
VETNSRRGAFIVFEGIDGAGKSTHIARLARAIEARGFKVLQTREPGGTAIGERLRELVLHESMGLETECLLMFAARAEHLRSVILPALDRGVNVFCDRFTDATYAYQGGGRGMSIERIANLEQWVQGALRPDLVCVFDLPEEVAAQRRAAVRQADRFEQQDLDFFKRVRGQYGERAQQNPLHYALIDSLKSPDDVYQSLEKIVLSRCFI